MYHSKILLVEDDAVLRNALVDTLELAKYQCTALDNAEDAILELKSGGFDLVISDVQMSGIGGLGLLKHLSQYYPKIPLLLITAFATIDMAVKAIKLGAVDYLSKPFAPEVLLAQVSRYLPTKINDGNPIAVDEKSLALFELARKVANSDASVMILGPSGSGKEVLAKYVHQNSPRSEKPFVAINCAAIPENMLEATLFGYEKGAFTGAYQACIGKFEQAQGGTLLLDEISEIDLSLQAKLLRVLQEKEVERLGGRKTIKLDVRVLSTSNRQLKQSVVKGEFREDLYYRLNVFPLEWPALNARKKDIVPLAEHLLIRHASVQNIAELPELDPLAKEKLVNHSWPGNVRELENVMQRALILTQNNQVTSQDIILDEKESLYIQSLDELEIGSSKSPSFTHSEVNSSVIQNKEASDGLGKELQAKEHVIILDMLLKCQGSRKLVAEKLGISGRTLRYKMAKMRELGIELPC